MMPTPNLGDATIGPSRLRSRSGGFRIVLGASLGTVFEWYDFFLYGSLAANISKQFFAGVNEVTGFILALMTFAAGFAVRPLGALVFGRMGDLVGRKRTFLTTIVIMGSATLLVGLLPGYASIGIAAPITLVSLRLLQGLAIGGEYGGAAVYVAEHAPVGRRGEFTSWIQATGSLGLLCSLLVTMLCRATLGPAFESWGWRIPFLFSAVLLAISVYLRLQLAESPVFQQMVARGERSKAPLTESLGRWRNLRTIGLVLYGACAGMAVVFYCGQFYALFFMTQILKVDVQAATLLMAAAILIVAPFYVVCGRLSDRVGRKPVVLLGCVLAATTYFPIFHAITHFANPALERAAQRAPVTVVTNLRDCSFQFDPIGRKRFSTPCDIVKSALTKAGVPYTTVAAYAGQPTLVRIGESDADIILSASHVSSELEGALRSAGYPAKADKRSINYPMVLLMLVLLVGYVAPAYAPLAAWMVEIFPAQIRYTSVSIPYHVAVGWFGGFLPTVSFAIVALTGDMYSGLWYAVTIAGTSALVGALFLKDTLRKAAGNGTQ